MYKIKDIECGQCLDYFMSHTVVIKHYGVTIGQHSSLMKYKLDKKVFNPDNAFGDENQDVFTESK